MPLLATPRLCPRSPRRHTGPLVAAGALLAVGVLLPACTANGSSDNGPTVPASHQVLKVGLSGEPKPVIVGADQGTVGYSLNALIGRGLTQYDATGKVVPALASSYKAVDASTYQFNLRSGLRFNDGSPLTVQNVKNTLLYLSKPTNAARTLKGFENVARVDVKGDQVTVHLKSNDPDFLQYLADPTAFIAPDSSLKNTTAAYVGAGPFKVQRIQKGVKTVLVKNPDFYDASQVKLREVDLIYYPDDQARTNAIISGDVDLIDYVPWTSFTTIKSTDGLRLDAVPGPLMDIEFNVTKGPFANPRVREAVAYAVNRENVANSAFFGNARVTYGIPLDKKSPYLTHDSQNLWSYDPTKAKRLLAQAGYPDGFSATLLTSSQYAFHQDTALSVQADLRKIGIDLKLSSSDWATRMQAATDGNYDIKISGWSGIVTSPAYVEASLGGPDVAKSYHYENPDLMAAFAAGRTGATEAARKAGYAEAFSLVQKDVPLIPLVQRDQGFALANKVKGFTNIPGFASFYSFYAITSTYLVS
ncbi:ABC transporter substrate-binding protein [Streptomyces chartreusis]|uniref:ABC transporter substrate-binding protein n=1 Tax=Streptomyces chartreusis TaxID=1969 RepID=UPI00364DF359